MDYAIEFQIQLIVCVVGLERKQENRATSKQCDNKNNMQFQRKPREWREGKEETNEIILHVGIF